jgi:hypothetical protein
MRMSRRDDEAIYKSDYFAFVGRCQWLIGVMSQPLRGTDKLREIVPKIPADEIRALSKAPSRGPILGSQAINSDPRVRDLASAHASRAIRFVWPLFSATD